MIIENYKGFNIHYDYYEMENGFMGQEIYTSRASSKWRTNIEDVLKDIDNFVPTNPEETIEIIPEMKWFVRVDSQIPLPNENIYLDDELIVYPHYDSPKSSAHQFDTKEEAEKWTNPLTEAVQLPVEGE